ncbi:cutinase family protein [Nocardia sp. NPDC052566]|uniref:cutinase family protein n=1 Tax=Nocardia sp. NPDC052566 TaxID=3364330 RepID=UPI0037CA15AB
MPTHAVRGPTRPCGRPRRTLISSMCVIVAAGAVAITPAAAAPSPGDPACPPFKIIAVPGTGETNPNANPEVPVGLLKDIPAITQRLVGNAASTDFVPYTAAITPTYAASEANGVQKTKDALAGTAIRCSFTKFFLLGYSQGAEVAGDVAADIGQGKGPIPADKLLGTALIADPRRGTAGESKIGPNPPGDGIKGPRPGGFNGLPVATICDLSDLYCATPSDKKLLSGIGKVIGTTTLTKPGEKPTSTTLPADATDQALASGLGALDIDGLTAGVKTLSQAAAAGDAAGVRAAATGLQTKTADLSSVAGLIGRSNAAATLQQFPAATPQQHASSVLGRVRNVDIANFSRLLAGLAGLGQSVGLDQLTGAAADLTKTAAPLAGVGSSDVAAATGIVQSIQPVALLRQAALTTDKVSRIDFGGIFNDLKTLFDLAVSGQFGAMPDTINGLNQKLIGIVEAIESIDLTPLVTILSLIPTPEAQIAAVVIRVINNLDLVKLAQTVAAIVKNVMAGQLLAIPPLVLNLFTTGLQSSGLLGGVDPAAVRGVTDNLNPASVMDAAATATAFYAGGSHQGYAKLVVSAEGDTALEWTGKWFASLMK